MQLSNCCSQSLGLNSMGLLVPLRVYSSWQDPWYIAKTCGEAEVTHSLVAPRRHSCSSRSPLHCEIWRATSTNPSLPRMDCIFSRGHPSGDEKSGCSSNSCLQNSVDPPPPKRAQNEEKLYKISRKSPKLTLSRRGEHNFMDKRFCGHLAVSASRDAISFGQTTPRNKKTEEYQK